MTTTHVVLVTVFMVTPAAKVFNPNATQNNDTVVTSIKAHTRTCALTAHTHLVRAVTTTSTEHYLLLQYGRTVLLQTA